MEGFVLRFGNYIPWALAALAHLAGVVVAIILLVRKKGTAAVLALIAFVLLLLLDVGRILQLAASVRMVRLFTQAPRALPWAQAGLGCCCGVLDLAAIICLVIALWKGAGPGGDEAEEEL
jgi:hypothetical protein